jgi:hypothetical protein
VAQGFARRASFAAAVSASGASLCAYRYLSETQYRFNRRFDLKVILQRLIRAATRPASAPRSGSGWLKHSADQE